MTNSNGWRRPRPITKRIVIKGNLILESPAHFGSGDVAPFAPIDMALLRDPLSGKPLLPGASIAGALRNYLRTREFGYHQKQENLTEKLFGGGKSNDNGEQSSLIIHDSIADNYSIEVRDGVRIDAKTRTAKEGAKFDIEVLSAGTTFPLEFELLVNLSDEDNLKVALRTALEGFSIGEIGLGMRKNRGLGKARVIDWQVWEYDMTNPADMLVWLSLGRSFATTESSPGNLETLTQKPLPDARDYFQLTATFKLDGSILIGGGADPFNSGADDVHLYGWFLQSGKVSHIPIVPGSSFAGVIRHRALKITNTLSIDKTLANQMFGTDEGVGENKLIASRVWVSDSKISGGNPMVQNRIKIDRFTGGAHDTALFSEMALFSNKDATLTLELRLVNPKDSETGLLLHILKDLWDGDLAIGGNSSIGRGRLTGLEATLTMRRNDTEKTWTLRESPTGLAFIPENAAVDLEQFAQKLNETGGIAQ